MFSTVHPIHFVKETPNFKKPDLRLTYETHCARPYDTEVEISVLCVAGRIYFCCLLTTKAEWRHLIFKANETMVNLFLHPLHSIFLNALYFPVQFTPH
jgi:hypothetical protein